MYREFFGHCNKKIKNVNNQPKSTTKSKENIFKLYSNFFFDFSIELLIIILTHLLCFFYTSLIFRFLFKNLKRSSIALHLHYIGSFSKVSSSFRPSHTSEEIPLLNIPSCKGISPFHSTTVEMTESFSFRFTILHLSSTSNVEG